MAMSGKDGSATFGCAGPGLAGRGLPGKARSAHLLGKEGSAPRSELLVPVWPVTGPPCAHGFVTTDCEKARSARLPGKERSAPT